MNYGELILKGKSKKEVLFSTYVCHPSMANNELSGPTVMTYISKWLLNMKNRKYTYRIIFIPETIGSISYLKINKKFAKNTCLLGLIFLVLEIIGLIHFYHQKWKIHLVILF